MKSEEFLAMARSDPEAALRLGKSMLDSLDSDTEQRAAVYRALGIAARVAGTMAEAIAFGERAVAEAEASGDDVLNVEALVTWAGSVAMAGDTTTALRKLDDADRLHVEATKGLIWFQRGTVFTISGDTVAALDAYTRALPLFRRARDDESVSATLHNRGLLQIYAGALGKAESDLLSARTFHEKSGDFTAIAGVDHNLGLLAWYQGDIPRSLSWLQESEERLMKQSGSKTPVHATRSEVLLSAGLFTEAHSLAKQIAASNRSNGLGEHEADALLVAAQAALMMGGQEEAMGLADAASSLFMAQGRSAWHANSERVSIEAKYLMGHTSQELRSSALKLAEALDRDRHLVAGAFARLLAGRIALDLGAITEGAADLDQVAAIRKGPLELMIQARLAASLVRRARLDRRGAFAAARAGLRLIDDHQSAIGASDLRAGIERRGGELGEIGLSLALESRIARSAFRWMERTRARGLRFRPVLSWNDPVQAADLAALRQISSQARTATGEERARIDRRERALQQAIKDRSRRTKTRGVVVGPGVADLSGEVADRLGDRTLLEFAAVGDVLWAVVARNGRFSLRRLGEVGEAMRELVSLRFSLRVLARRGGDTTSAAAIAQRVDSLLFAELNLGEGPVIVVPTPGMYAAPWSALPTLRTRPVTVAPSSEIWLRRSGSRPSRGAVVVVGGPDLAYSSSEAREVARIHQTPLVLGPKEATVDGVAGSIDGARIAHIACHAEFQSENPMFSSLRLADGDLNVYDIERIRRSPSLIILSACDSGFTENRPGEELLGLSAALLSMGTKSIVASVGLVPDSSATKDLMVALHRGIVSGLSPSLALNKAQMAVSGTAEGSIAAASFVCIGAD
jgi:tetratricopeptide (TPR) repeat protein